MTFDPGADLSFMTAPYSLPSLWGPTPHYHEVSARDRSAGSRARLHVWLSLALTLDGFMDQVRCYEQTAGQAGWRDYSLTTTILSPIRYRADAALGDLRPHLTINFSHPALPQFIQRRRTRMPPEMERSVYDRRYFLVPRQSGQHSNDPDVLQVGYTTASQPGLWKQWLQQCTSSHPTCQSLESGNAGFLPKRLVHIIASKSEILWRLVRPGNEVVEYVTLSHCWGSSRHTLLGAPLTRPMKIGCALAITNSCLFIIFV